MDAAQSVRKVGFMSVIMQRLEATTVLNSDVVWPVAPNSTTLIIHI